MKLYPASRLPKDPAQRFAVLFAEQPRWEASELEPYIASLKVRPPFQPGLNLGRDVGLAIPCSRAMLCCSLGVELRQPTLLLPPSTSGAGTWPEHGSPAAQVCESFTEHAGLPGHLLRPMRTKEVAAENARCLAAYPARC